MKDLLAYYDNEAAGQKALEMISQLASAHDAHVTVVAASPNVFTPSTMPQANGTSVAMIEEIAKSKTYAEAEVERMARSITNALSSTGLSFEIHKVSADIETVIESLTTHTRHRDLLIIGHTSGESRVYDALVKATVFQSGRPVILVPQSFKIKSYPKKVLVAWDGGKEATRSIHDALPLLKKAQRVTLLTVGYGSDGGYGEQPGADMAAHLSRHGLKVEVQHDKETSSLPEQVILHKASQEGYDLVVMGAYGHSRVMEWVLGSVTRTVLKEMAVPVFLSH